MFNILLTLIVFIFSLIVLIKASDIFTDNSVKIGLSMGLPAFIVGVTIVAFGTSLPELISAIFSFTGNVPEIVIGNVVGANIANIFLILGLSAIIGKKIKLSRDILNVDLPMLVASTILFVLIIVDGIINLFEIITLIALFIIYFFYVIRDEDRSESELIKKEVKQIKKELGLVSKMKLVSFGTWASIIISAILIYFSAKFTVDSIIKLSELFFMEKEIIAATIFSIGTTLPEMMVSVSAAKKGMPEIAIGNILGSNIFNILIVIGLPALFGSIVLVQLFFVFSIDIFIIIMLVVATTLFFIITQDKEITKWEGYFLLIFYVFFITKLLGVF